MLWVFTVAVENVRRFEAKVWEARKAEAEALTDHSGDERNIVKRISDAQGLATFFLHGRNWPKRRFQQPLPQSRPSSKPSPRI